MRSCIRALGDKFAAARGTGRRPHRSQGVGCTTKCSSSVRLFAGGVSAGATAAPRTWLLLWGWGNPLGNGLLLAPGGAARLGRQRQRRASPLLLRAARRSRRARLRLGQGASVIRCNESIVFDDVSLEVMSDLCEVSDPMRAAPRRTQLQPELFTITSSPAPLGLCDRRLAGLAWAPAPC